MPILPGKIKVGIIIPSRNVPLWVYKILSKVKLSPYATVEVLIMGRENFLQSLPNNWVINLVLKAERIFINLEKESYLTQYDTIPLFSDVPHLTLNQTEGKNFVAAIQQYPIDLLINLGDTFLDQQIFKAACCDLWSLRSDISQEVFTSKEVIRIWLEILKKEAEKPLIIFRALEKFEHFFAYKNIQDYYRQSISFIPEQLKKLYHLGEEEYFKSIKEKNLQHKSRPTRHLSKPVPSMLILGKYYRDRLKNIKRKKMYFDQWSLLYSFDNDVLCPPARSFSKLIPPTDRDWADPHIVYRDGVYYIFIEELFYKRGIGHISVLKLAKDGSFEPPVVVLEKPFHLSYPHVFRNNDEYFMIPESAGDRTISLFKCIEFPYKWELKQTLMMGVYAVDTTLLFYNNKWWLFTNLKEDDDSSLMNLHIFFAEDLFSKSWNPHYLNPVVSNIGSSRGAGKFIFLEDKIYRPSQNSEIRYGHSVVLNQIVVLNEKEYKEVEMGNIPPDDEKAMLATHTLNFEMGLTVMDARIKRKR